MIKHSEYIGSIVFHERNFVIHQISDSISPCMNIDISCVGKRLQDTLPEFASQVDELKTVSHLQDHPIYFSSEYAATLEENRYYKAVIHPHTEAPEELLQAEVFDVTEELIDTLDESTEKEKTLLSYWNNGETVVWTTDKNMRIVSATVLGKTDVRKLYDVDAGMPLFEYLERHLPTQILGKDSIDGLLHIENQSLGCWVSLKFKPIMDTESHNIIGSLVIATPNSTEVFDGLQIPAQNMQMYN